VLITDRDSAVAETLEAFNVTFDAIRARVEDSIGPASDPQSGHLPFSPRAKLALERTRCEAETGGYRLVEPSHILAALMFDTQSAAAKTMASMNLAPTAVRGRLLHRGPSANQSDSD
jgi:ATP-dependent Clp protease ATP-binding subunit ClpC